MCVSLDRAWNVYLADTESHSIRYLDVKKGTIEVLAGTGSQGDGPDGGAVFIRDSENHRVRVWRK